MTMTRRELFERAGALTISTGLSSLPGVRTAEVQTAASPEPAEGPRNTPASPPQLAGTEPLTIEGDLAAKMVEGMHNFLIAQTAA
jgi:hypothetical protein